MRFCATAPGSAMLIGEHAVLRGHDSICCAIDHEIKVILSIRDDDKVIVNSRIACHETDINKLSDHPKLSFVMECLRASFLPSGINIDIESEKLPPNIGFGSSAAVVSALLGVLNFWIFQKIDQYSIHQQGLEIIKKIQGRGSGADLAASIFGGVVSYKINPVEINFLKYNIKKLTFVYCGYKKSTSDVLKIIEDAENKNNKLYKSIFKQMGIISKNSIKSWREENLSEVYSYFCKYHQLMCEIGLNTKEIDKIVCLMKNAGLNGVKISGSGLGDCVLGFGHKSFDLYEYYKVNINDQGLRVKVI